MATPLVWFRNNDILLTLAGLRSSTMASGTYLNSSTRLTVSVWKASSTVASTNRVVNAQNVPYTTGTTNGANGTYQTVVQSTQQTMTAGTPGMAIFVLSHLGLNGEWRVPFHVEYRGST